MAHNGDRTYRWWGEVDGIAWMVRIFDMTLRKLNWQHVRRTMRSDYRLRVRRSDGYSVPQRRTRTVIPSQRKNPTWTFPSFFGHEPAISIVRSQVQTDPGSYILIIPRTMSVKGVFAVGDVQNVLYRQAVYSCDWDWEAGRARGHHVARCSVVENYHEQPQDRKPYIVQSLSWLSSGTQWQWNTIATVISPHSIWIRLQTFPSSSVTNLLPLSDPKSR